MRALLALLAACGGGSPDITPDTASTEYPAFAPDAPRVITLGGPVLDAMQIVTVVWTADPDYKRYEVFDDAIGTSTYWRAVTAEYGIGPATSGGHVELTTTPPASVTAASIATLVKQGLANGWPTPTAQTLYLLMLPPTVAFGTCDDSGEHEDVAFGGHRVAYGWVAEKCVDFPSLPIVDNATETAAHELAESATDPFGEQTYVGFDAAHYVWELFTDEQDELADACEFFDDSYYTDPELGAYVQRSWSNAAAAAGHSPCVPAPAEPYFNVTPLAPETVTTLNTTNKPHTSNGFRVPVGTTRTFDIGFYSDAPSDDWTVSAVEGNGIDPVASPHVTATIDPPTGNNGTTAKVTVTVSRAPTLGNQLLLTLVATRGSTTHRAPILIGAE